MPDKLSDADIHKNMADIPDWHFEEGKLRREFKFANFVQAFGFMASAAIEAEKMNHHPEWCNVYSKVVVQLVTHSADGITELDFLLAKKMDAVSDALQR